MVDAGQSQAGDRVRRRRGDVELSLVVPMFNEAAGVDAFFARVEPVMEQIGATYEIVCVNDGSRDDTLARLLAHRARNPRIRVVDLSRNFGKDVALSAGLEHASGRAVIPLDADLQDPPELIAAMVKLWREGFHVVNARRVSRAADSLAKRGAALAFYRVFNWMAERPIPENIGDFRLLDRRALEAVLRMPERDRFLKGMFSWVGFRTTEVVFERPPREAGETKWNFLKLWHFAVSGITAFSTFPLRVWNYVGGFIAVCAFFYASFLVLRTLVFGRDVPGYASIMVVVLFLGGIQLLSLGVLGEYIGRIYNEVKGRPLYIVNELHGFDDQP